MARVLIAAQSWGVVANNQGTGASSQTATLVSTSSGSAATIYQEATGSGQVADFTTDADGVLPGWVDSDTYTLSVAGESFQVEAVSATTLPTGVVTSTNILDGTILNADVNASAAITGGKLDLTSGTGAATFTLPASGQVSIVNAPSGDTRTLMVGRTSGNAGAAGMNDLCFDHDTDQLLVRKMVVGEISDTPGLLIRRANGTGYAGTMTQILDQNPCGYVGWQAHDGGSQAAAGWTATGSNGFLGQIYMRAAGNMTDTNRGGDFYIATSRQDEASPAPRERVIVANTGKVTINAPTDASGVAAPGKDTFNIRGGTDTGITWTDQSCNWYSPASATLKTDTALHVGTVFRHLGTTLGFYGVTAVSRPTAYTQTYNTTTRTHANDTASDMATTASTQTTPWGFASQAQADAIATKFNALRVDVDNIKGVVNSVIDDLQANGLLQ